MTLKFYSVAATVVLSLGVLVVLLVGSANVAVAQRAGSSSSDSNSGNGVGVLSRRTYQTVQRIQKLMTSEKYSEALSHAQDLLPTVKNESKYAYALINQMIANIYLLQNKYTEAEKYLEVDVKLNALAPQAQRSVVVQLATIYLSQNKYQKSIDLYKEVIAQTKAEAKKKGHKASIPPRLYYHLGLAYSFAEEYPEAYTYIHRAIEEQENLPDTTDENGKKVKPKPVPKEWYQNLFIVVYKQHKYPEANRIAKNLVAQWPNDKDFWSYYANTFLLMKKDKDALNVYALMAKKGMLKSKDEQMQLVSLLNEAETPYKAATKLNKFMEDGVVPKTDSNYSLLSSLWMQAKEWDNALDALGKQAELAPTGKVYIQQASVYLSKLQYHNAMEAARQALKKGGLKEPGQAWMILGQAAFHAKNTHTALEAFHRAENYRAQRKDAQGWIKFVEASTKGSR